MQYPNLFSLKEINQLMLKNRIMASPMVIIPEA